MKLEIEESQPLADRIRPTTLDEFVGQGHIRNRVEAFTQSKRLPSLLLFGPPGCGKSTLALLLAKITGKKSLRVSAPEAGLTALRKRLPGNDILILDELHRFSKAQQDFFLPLLETGEIILLATTTENPSFSVTRQLLSRLHVLRLRPLSRDELVQVAHRGAEELDLELDEECYQILAAMGGGDARTLLNLLEYTAELPKAKRTPGKTAGIPARDRGARRQGRRLPLRARLGPDQVHPGQRPGRGPVLPGLSPGERRGPAIRDPAVDHLRIRGRRPGQSQALPQAMACHQAIETIGMPEGFIPMAQTVVYPCPVAQKQLHLRAYRTTQKEVRENGRCPCPCTCATPPPPCNGNGDTGALSVPAQFPQGLGRPGLPPQRAVGPEFYHPKDQGEESKLVAWLRQFKKNL